MEQEAIEILRNESSERMMWDSKVGQSKLSAAIEAEEMNMFAILKPKIFQDGDQWCVLYGDDIQSGIAGFGDTPRKAVWAFNKAWDKDISHPKSFGVFEQMGIGKYPDMPNKY